MTNRERFYRDLVLYLSEPKDNDPFNSVRETLLSTAKDLERIEIHMKEFTAVPGVNMNEEPDTDNPY